jgi:hypothetical protein
MARSKERRKRRSAARARAEQHSSGYETTVLKMPEGVGFWSPKIGIHKIDIIPYKVGKENPAVEKGWTREGDEYYERTYYCYRRIGAEEKSYVAPGRTFGHVDYIQEFRAREASKDGVDPKYLKSLDPKERQLFLILDHADMDKGVQIWDCSYHLFGRLLDSRINNSSDEDGWDQFDDPSEDGFTLRVTIEQQSGGGYTFNGSTAIDFIPRKSALPDKIVNHGICLDDLLIEYPYEKLKAIFLGSADGDKSEDKKEEESNDNGEQGKVKEDKPAPKSAEKPAPKAKEKEEEHDPKAGELGLKEKDKVKYKGLICNIVRISGDGTLLTLIDEDDDVHKAVAPKDVETLKSQDDELESETADVGSDDDKEKWDYD